MTTSRNLATYGEDGLRITLPVLSDVRHLALCGECRYGVKSRRVGVVFDHEDGRRTFCQWVRVKKGSLPTRGRVAPGKDVPPEGLVTRCRNGHAVVVPSEGSPSADGVFYLRSATTSAARPF